MFQHLYKSAVCLTCLLLSFSLTACTSNKEKELSDFSNAIEQFSNDIKEKDNAINNIDPESEAASKDVLSLLDELDTTFKDLAEIEVPNQYSAVVSLADEASENMTQAVSFYHSALDNDEYNEEDADVAYQYYKRAMTRVNYIGMILNGEVPEGENVTVYEEDKNASLIDQITE